MTELNKNATSFNGNNWEYVKRGGNYVLKGDGFHVSYNPGNSSIVPTEETALYDGKHWRILNGDFRKEYKASVKKGLDSCIKIYNKHKDKHCSAWSTA